MAAPTDNAGPGMCPFQRQQAAESVETGAAVRLILSSFLQARGNPSQDQPLIANTISNFTEEI